MQLEVRKYLFDIKRAITYLVSFTDGKTQDDYLNDPLLRSAVERQFEIIGEAVSKLVKLDPAFVSRISEYRKLVNFRNILIHGYAAIDDHLVWDLLQSKLPVLISEIESLSREE